LKEIHLFLACETLLKLSQNYESLVTYFWDFKDVASIKSLKKGGGAGKDKQVKTKNKIKKTNNFHFIGSGALFLLNT